MKPRRSLPVFGVLVALLALVPASAWAQGGPPLITDDPDTPGPGYWEINISALLRTALSQRRLESPRLDMNFGVGERIQLKFEVPWLGVRAPGEPARSGAGNAVAGLKWRFVGQEGHRLAWSVYPQFEVNTDHSSVDKGIVEAGHQLLLPTELTFEVAHAELNVEVGRQFIQRGDDGWVFGISTEGHVSRRLELLAELHTESRGTDPTETIVQVAARPKITRQILLLLAVGRAVHGAPSDRARLLLYTGLQLNLPRLRADDRPAAYGRAARR